MLAKTVNIKTRKKSSWKGSFVGAYKILSGVRRGEGSDSKVTAP